MLTFEERFTGYTGAYMQLCTMLYAPLEQNAIELKNSYFAFNGSRNYGYHNENSDFDVIGFYVQNVRRSSIWQTEFVPHLIDVSISDFYNKNLVVNYTLWELEKFFYLLAHQSLQPFELLFAQDIKSFTTINFEILREAYFSNLYVGLIYNLINFAQNSYKDYVTQSKDKRNVFGTINKNLFYANMRLFQASKLIELASTPYNYNNYVWLFTDRILHSYEFKQFEFTYELFDQYKSFCRNLAMHQKDSYKESRFDMFYSLYKETVDKLSTV